MLNTCNLGNSRRSGRDCSSEHPSNLREVNALRLVISSGIVFIRKVVSRWRLWRLESCVNIDGGSLIKNGPFLILNLVKFERHPSDWGRAESGRSIKSSSFKSFRLAIQRGNSKLRAFEYGTLDLQLSTFRFSSWEIQCGKTSSWWTSMLKLVSPVQPMIDPSSKSIVGLHDISKRWRLGNGVTRNLEIAL